jgi:Holliday junction resolvase RusA-like endonuclease
MKLDEEYQRTYGDIPEDIEYRLQILSSSRKIITDKDNTHKWNKLSLVFYIEPKPTPRPKLGRFGVFYVKGAKDNKRFFEDYAKKHDLPFITTACKFEVRSYLPTPKSMTKQEKYDSELGEIRPISKPDWDNLGKAYSDMVNDILIYDDALIIEGTSKKFYSIKPRVEIDIEYMDGYDSNYNQRKYNKIIKE